MGVAMLAVVTVALVAAALGMRRTPQSTTQVYNGAMTAAPSASPIPTGLSSAKQVTDKINGQNVSLLIAPKPNGQLVIAAHGHGGNVTEWSSGKQQTGILGALIDAGYSVASSDAHGDAWGNPQSVADYKDLRAWALTKGNFKSTVVLGQSMGGLAALQLLTQVPDATTFVGIFPVCNLSTVVARFPDVAKAWPQGSAGQLSPVDLSGTSGKRLIFFSSPDDTVVPKATNTDACAAAAKAASADVSVVQASGDHGDQSAFQPAAVVKFLAGP